MKTADNENPLIMGRKVFFLYPHSVIQNDMITILINHEYEVYTVNDHEKMLKIAKYFPESILFINIDNKLSEEEWESYIVTLLNNKDTISRIGILTYNKDKNLAKKYLMDMMLPCGFIVLSLSFEQSAATILKMLMVNEAKGRRKFLRASALDSDNTKLNFKYNGLLYTGNVTDISVAGMAFSIDYDIDIQINTHLDDIQLQLKGIICRVSGVIVARRDGNEGNFVLIFKDTDDLSKIKIHNFIYNTLQKNMQNKINMLK